MRRWQKWQHHNPRIGASPFGSVASCPLGHEPCHAWQQQHEAEKQRRERPERLKEHMNVYSELFVQKIVCGSNASRSDDSEVDQQFEHIGLFVECRNMDMQEYGHE